MRETGRERERERELFCLQLYSPTMNGPSMVTLLPKDESPALLPKAENKAIESKAAHRTCTSADLGKPANHGEDEDDEGDPDSDTEDSDDSDDSDDGSSHHNDHHANDCGWFALWMLENAGLEANCTSTLTYVDGHWNGIYGSSDGDPRRQHLEWERQEVGVEELN